MVVLITDIKVVNFKNAIYVIVLIIVGIYFMATESEGSAIILSANILL